MPTTGTSKRKREDDKPVTKRSKIRKQKYYSSPSGSEKEDEFTPVNLADSDSDLVSTNGNNLEIEKAKPTNSKSKKPRPQSSASSDSEAESDASSQSSNQSLSESTKPSRGTKVSKRNDPSAFASSISAILSSKLSTSKRSDPVLSRNANAADANASLANAKLEAQARHKLRQDKKAALQKGRVKDVLLGTDDPTIASHKATILENDNVNNDAGPDGQDQELRAEKVKEMQELEKRLRKTAQRGVVKLFNAVRQAQVRAEEAAKEASAKGVVGRARKAEKVEEMSRQGFLEMVAAGGTAAQKEGARKIETAEIEEA